MKRVKRIDLSRMGLHESIGYFQGVAQLLNEQFQGETEVERMLAKQAEAFRKAFDELTEASGYKPTYQRRVNRSDRKRDESWRAARRYAKAMTSHPVPEVQRAAEKIDALFRAYGEIGNLSQIKETGTLESLTGQLRNLGEELLEKAGFTVWLERMEEDARQFNEVVRQRTEERAARPKGLVQQRRRSVELLYAELIKSAELSTLLDPACASTFIAKLNALAVDS